MNTIYEPGGKAREYSPLALNIYSGCDHGCKYCYVPKILQPFNPGYDHSNVFTREDIITELERRAKNYRGEKKQVLLSFLTDPYPKYDEETQWTRQALEILYKYKFPVALLSKGGFRMQRDKDIILKFKQNIKIGASLTFDNDTDTKRVEPGSSLQSERIENLKIFHDLGIRTWVSFEPTFSLAQTVNLFHLTKDFVNEYQIGRLNHFNQKLDLYTFLITMVNLCREHNKDFYIKKDLAIERKEFQLYPKEVEMDYLTLKWQEESGLDLFQ